MSLCTLDLFLTFFGVFYFLIFPAVVARTVTRRFDGDLFNDRYWQSIEAMFPFYRYRRTMIYLGAISWGWAARRRFPGYDFRPKVGPAMLFASRLYVAAMLYGSLSALYTSVFGVPRCQTRINAAARALDRPAQCHQPSAGASW